VTRVIEEAWFTQRPLDLVYRASNGETTKRRVRIESLVMERTLTLINCLDESLGEKRQFRLDRIERAELA
jgi:predicted DNA-binding transcriptional regulator YafY